MALALCKSSHLFPSCLGVTVEVVHVQSALWVGVCCSHPQVQNKHWLQRAGGRLLLSNFTVWFLCCMTNFMFGLLQLLRGLGDQKQLLSKNCLILIEDPWESHPSSVFVWRVSMAVLCWLLSLCQVPLARESVATSQFSEIQSTSTKPHPWLNLPSAWQKSLSRERTPLL